MIIKKPLKMKIIETYYRNSLMLDNNIDKD